MTGEQVDPEEVKLAQQKERDSLASFDTYRRVPRSECMVEEGASVVPSRWLIVKKAKGVVKARLMAQ